MNNWGWLVSAVQTLGVPAAVAAYFMIRDWFFMTETVKLQATMVELLRQLVAK